MVFRQVQPRANTKRLFFIQLEAVLVLLGAMRAHAVREAGIRMGGDAGLDLLPITLVIADTFARRAYRQHPAERSNLVGRGGEPLDQLFPFVSRKFLLRNIARNGGSADDLALNIFDG